MLDLLRDVGLSFCPASVRSTHRPHSSLRVLQAAILTGALQTFLCSRWFFSGYMSFLTLRNHQYGSALGHQNQSTQAWFAFVFSLEYVLVRPLALFLVYIALEGVLRFVGGLCASEILPSLPVLLAFRIKTYFQHRKAQRSRHPLAAIPDSIEVLADGERLRIAASRAKAKWNASITIGINGEWYEVEQEENGTPPRTYVYVLRRAPSSKILRAYEEYHLPTAAKIQ